jgi:thiamine kinase-like enzyme
MMGGMMGPAALSGEALVAALPCWNGSIEIEPLGGGLSNANFLVRDATGKHVVRLGRDYDFHHVSRERELMSAQAAHACGFAPEVEYAAHGVMVSRYIAGRTFAAADVRANADRIAGLVRAFHAEMPNQVSGAGFMFWVFHVIRDYARSLAAGGSRMAGELPRYLALAAELEAAQTPLPIVFGHNDLLPANILDDGDRLWLIDFEYAGFNTAMFDLAGLSSNSGMSDEEATHLLTIYFGNETSKETRQSHAAMQCASLLREAMWSMISELHLDAPGANYIAYTQDNLARLETALESYRTKYGMRQS